jgi:hypothetical protein
MSVIIRLLCLVDGTSTPYDGQYLVSYDPERTGLRIGGQRLQCTIETTTDPAKAKQYPDHGAAMEDWRRQSVRRPFRPWDGKPNRPLTAFTVEVVRA